MLRHSDLGLILLSPYAPCATPTIHAILVSKPLRFCCRVIISPKLYIPCFGRNMFTVTHVFSLTRSPTTSINAIVPPNILRNAGPPYYPSIGSDLSTIISRNVSLAVSDSCCFSDSNNGSADSASYAVSTLMWPNGRRARSPH